MRKGRTSPNPTEPHLTTTEVAFRYGTGREQVHRWIRAGQLTAVRIGKLIRIREADLARFEAAHLINDPDRQLGGKRGAR